MKIRIAVMSAVLAVSSAFVALPNLSGTWAGTVKGTDYKAVSSTSNNDSTDKTKPITGTIAATFVVNSSDNTLTMNLTISPLKVDANDQPFSLVATGYVGADAFWATGFRQPDANDGTGETFYLTGHINKGAIKGLGVAFKYNEDSEFLYSLKQSGATVAVRDEADSAAAPPDMAARDSNTQVVGKATGLQYTLATGKAAKVKNSYSGNFVTTSNGTVMNATIAYTMGTTVLNFTATGPAFGSVFLVVGTDTTGAYTLLMPLHTTHKSGKGLGYIFSSTAFDELKITAQVVNGG